MRYSLKSRTWHKEETGDGPLAGVPSSKALLSPPMPAPSRTSGLYGIVRAGQLMAGFSIDAIREVVPHPATLQAWPRTRPEILGSFNLRGCVIPVLDLQVLLKLAHPGASEMRVEADAAPPVILIVRDGDQVLGLVISEICGVERLEENEIAPVRYASQAMAGLVPATFATASHSGLLLDVSGLLALPDMPCVSSVVQAALSRSARGEPHLLVEMGKQQILIAASVIDATVPETEIHPAAVDDPLWVGLLSHKGHRIPVVDSLALFGLGAFEPAGRTPCLVVRLADGSSVALRIDRVDDMVQLRTQDTLPLQGQGGAQLGFFSKVAEGRDCLQLVVATEELQGCAELAALSRLSEPDDALNGKARASQGDGGGTSERKPFLIVQLGQDHYAVPLEQVAEILPQGNRRAAMSEASGPRSLIAHRGSAIPVYALARFLGHASPAGDTAFTVVSNDGAGRSVGFEVDALVSVERVPLQTLRRKKDGAPIGLLDNTISRQGEVCAVLDLQRFAEDIVRG